MIKIISHGRDVEEVEYYIYYEWVEKPDTGFMFPCNQDGDINFNKMTEKEMEDFDKCESDEYEVIYRGLQRFVNRYREHTVGQCYCGEPITLNSNRNQCGKCSSMYDSSGQELSIPKNSTADKRRVIT